MRRIVRYAESAEHARDLIAADPSRVAVRFDQNVVGLVIDDDCDADHPKTPAAPLLASTSLAVEAWRDLGDAPEPPGAEAASLVAAVVLVWLPTGASDTTPASPHALASSSVSAQQRELVQHVMRRNEKRADVGIVRLCLWQLDLRLSSWAESKRAALEMLGNHPDTRTFAFSLLTCDEGTRYDTSVVCFFAPYRLRRSHATIIREERHSFHDVAAVHSGAPMRRHVAMVRLASPNAIVNEVA